ncbi:MAG: GNAT family N-acetyltransferase [Phycisphaerales bacterium]|nr:GNAT family N-acetyltransferase [Phycisphaerales bacterium]
MAFRIIEAVDPPHMDAARTLFMEYAGGLGFDLEFQNFERELSTLPGAYAPPRGCLLLALAADGAPRWIEDSAGDAPARVPAASAADSAWAGCVALRPFDSGICELKRMYVRPAHRGRGLGRILAEEIIARARTYGYARMRLDTIGARMMPAVKLYRSLGFEAIAAYRPNPIPGAEFYELRL